MPLDPQWPHDKLQSILQHARVSLVLWAHTAVLGMLALGMLLLSVTPAHSTVSLWRGCQISECLSLPSCAGSGPLPDGSCRALEMPEHLLRPSVSPVVGYEVAALISWRRPQRRLCSSVVYIMPTSGSTGKPRAVRGTLDGVPPYMPQSVLPECDVCACSSGQPCQN